MVMSLVQDQQQNEQIQKSIEINIKKWECLFILWGP